MDALRYQPSRTARNLQLQRTQRRPKKPVNNTHGEHEHLTPHEHLELGLAAKPFEKIDAAHFLKARREDTFSEEPRSAARELAGHAPVEEQPEASLTERFHAAIALTPQQRALVGQVLGRVPDDPELALDMKMLLEQKSFKKLSSEAQSAVLERLAPLAMNRVSRRAYLTMASSDGFVLLSKMARSAALDLFRSGAAYRHPRLAGDLCKLFDHPNFQTMRPADQAMIIEQFGRHLTDPEARSTLLAIISQPDKKLRRELGSLMRSKSYRALSGPAQGLATRMLLKHRDDPEARKVLTQLLATPGFIDKKARVQVELIHEMLGPSLVAAKQWVKSLRAPKVMKPGGGGASPAMPRVVVQASMPISTRAPRLMSGRPESEKKLTVRDLHVMSP